MESSVRPPAAVMPVPCDGEAAAASEPAAGETSSLETRSKAVAVDESRSIGRINQPRAAIVEANASGVPARVNRQDVAFVREEWRVVDRWWTEEPVSRRYFDVVLESGQQSVVFRDEDAGCWFSQKA